MSGTDPSTSEATSGSIVIDADPSQVMGVIADFDSYPAWTAYFREVEVEQVGPDGRAEQVRFVLDAAVVRDDYSLRYEWEGLEAVRWSLVRSADVLDAMDGSYTLRVVDAGTEVTYSLSVQLRIEMLGMFQRKAEKLIIDTALKELKKRVEAHTG